MSRIALHARMTGLVQGVFFRAWTAEQAGKLGVTGWVRNASDGSVEAHLEGEHQAVHQMLDLLHCGPSSAQVEEVAVQETESDGADRFEVRH